jgi:hypothetical protein
MNSQGEEKPLEPQGVEVPANRAELPDQPNPGDGTGKEPDQGSDDSRPEKGSLPRGPFRPIADPGQETDVEERP